MAHDKYTRLQKYISIDGGQTFNPVSPAEYIPGELIEADSVDCGAQVITWVDIEGEYVCEMADPYEGYNRQVIPASTPQVLTLPSVTNSYPLQTFSFYDKDYRDSGNYTCSNSVVNSALQNMQSRQDRILNGSSVPDCIYWEDLGVIFFCATLTLGTTQPNKNGYLYNVNTNEYKPVTLSIDACKCGNGYSYIMPGNERWIGFCSSCDPLDGTLMQIYNLDTGEYYHVRTPGTAVDGASMGMRVVVGSLDRFAYLRD